MLGITWPEKVCLFKVSASLNRKGPNRMASMNVSILLILFIFAIATQAWSDPDKSMNNAANRVRPMKLEENEDVVQKKKIPVQKSVKLKKKVSSKPQSACCPDDGAVTTNTKRDVFFLKAVEEKRKARWVHVDQILYSPEFLWSIFKNDFSTFREPATTKSSDTDFNHPNPKPFPAGNKYFEGGTKSETLRHLESKKEEILKEIFMGLRFSFIPASRHVILELNVSPSYESGTGLIIPF